MESNAERLTTELDILRSILPDSALSSTLLPNGSTVVRVAVSVDFAETVRVLVWDWKSEESQLVASTSQLPAPVAAPPVVQPVLSINSTSNGPAKSTTERTKQPISSTKLKSSIAPSTTKQAARPKTLSAPNPLAPSFVPVPQRSTPPRNGRSKSTTKYLELRYLPSIDLEFTLSPHYPTDEPPLIDIASSSDGDWLKREWKLKLIEKMMGMWTGEECLWMMIDSCRTEDVVSMLGLTFPIRLVQATPNSPTTPPLSTLLSTHNASLLHSDYSTTTFHCQLCLSHKKGHSCLSLSSCQTQEVFCRNCLRDYFSLLIREGLVRMVSCPGIDCGKRRKVNEAESSEKIRKDELVDIVGEELAKRWELLVEKNRVESDPSIAFCPRSACQAPVAPLDDEDKLRVCPKCSYAFCIFCRKTWHGVRNPCALPQSSSIVSSYLAGTPEEQALLELKFGKANIRRLVSAFEEDRQNSEWLNANSMGCPGCAVRVEKSAGCSHMCCSRCSSHFCFRCGKSLSPTSPYAHYSDPSSACYNKLFDFQPGNEPPPEEWIGELFAEM